MRNFRKELLHLAAGYVILSIIFVIAFKNNSLTQVLRLTGSIYWMFVIPGYALALCSKQEFGTRLIIGIPVQVCVFGLASYYFGLAGWHLANHGLVLPLFSIAVGLFLFWKLKPLAENSQ